MEGGLTHGEKTPGFNAHKHTQIRKQQCFRAAASVLQEQSMCGEGSGTPGETRVMEGEKERGIAQGGVMLVWPVSRPPVLEHEKEQVVYTPVKKPPYPRQHLDVI